MKKILLAFLLISLSSCAFSWTQRAPQEVQSCQGHAPYGFPQTTAVQAICRQGYFVGYDASAKIPKYVTYTLIPQNALGCLARSNAFTADKSVTDGAIPRDYTGTIYDKGHQAPDGDFSWNQQVEFESFLMTNMAPQAGSFNRGIWKLLETSVRGWVAERNQSYTIYVGSVYNAQDKKIGSGVIVPHGFYKIVVNNQTREIAGWAFPHVAPYPNLGNDLVKFRMPITQIEQTAGVQFAFPQGSIELAPGREWPVDFGALEKVKRTKCGANATLD